MSSSADIQHELEQTRSRMSAELDALAHKLDIPSRAKDKVGNVTRRARSAAPSASDVQNGAESNPLALVLGGVAAGVLAGLLLPRTKLEDEHLGPIADRVRDEAVATGREAAQRGKSVVKQAAESAKDAAQEAGQHQATALQTSASKRANKVAASTRS